MTIYEQIKEVLKDHLGETLSYKEIKKKLISNFDTNPGSIILSDFCYNRYNSGIQFNQHLFIYIDRSMYKYVGENYFYTGFVYHKPKDSKSESVVGEWNKGKLYFYPEGETNKQSMIGITQIKKLYEEYFAILRFGRMFNNLKENTLSNLFIDEASQALPQASIGAIFRSKRVLAVGDPSQIKPVMVC